MGSEVAHSKNRCQAKPSFARAVHLLFGISETVQSVQDHCQQYTLISYRPTNVSVVRTVARLGNQDLHTLQEQDVFLFNRKKPKGKAIPLQAWTGPEDSRRLRLPDFKTIDT